MRQNQRSGLLRSRHRPKNPSEDSRGRPRKLQHSGALCHRTISTSSATPVHPEPSEAVDACSCSKRKKALRANMVNSRGAQHFAVVTAQQHPCVRGKRLIHRIYIHIYGGTAPLYRSMQKEQLTHGTQLYNSFRGIVLRLLRK